MPFVRQNTWIAISLGLLLVAFLSGLSGSANESLEFVVFCVGAAIVCAVVGVGSEICEAIRETAPHTEKEEVKK